MDEYLHGKYNIVADRAAAVDDKENEISRVEMAWALVVSFRSVEDYNRRTDSLQHPGGSETGFCGWKSRKRPRLGIIRHFGP